MAFAVHFGLLSLNWLVLAMLLWGVGTVAAEACATAILATVASVVSILIYQRALTFVAAGAGPPIAVLITLACSSHLPPLVFLPTALMLLVALLFAGILARAVPSILAAERRVNAAQAQYRIMADSTSDVIARLGLDGQRKYLSPSAQRLTGFSAEELAEKGMLATIHIDDHARVLTIADRVARGQGDATTEYRMLSKHGDVFWVESKITLVKFEGPDAPPEILSVTRDITARKILEFELIAAKERAEAASKAKSDFLANMSHELRTPLNAVIGFARVLQNSGLTPTQAQHAALIDEGGVALLAVINNVLDFSRLEAGALTPAEESFNSVNLTRSMCELLRLEATSKGITLEVLAPEGNGDLLGDAALVRQVLLNLIGNAVKFTERGGVVVAVSQSEIELDRSMLRVTVTDTGIGMSAACLERVFERFEQADASMSRRFGGAGLGLAISDRLVRLMDGRIGANSVEGEGSTFWFELDLPNASSIVDPVINHVSCPEQGYVAAEGSIRVLIVDDNATNRQLVVAVLSALNFECFTAGDGEEALDWVRRDPFDVVLMDVQMPVMDGLAATRAIRALNDPWFANVPIIGLSANVLPEQVSRCLEAGMNAHVGKPINPGQLLEVISQQTYPQPRSSPALAAA